MVQHTINLEDKIFDTDTDRLNAGCSNCGSGKAGDSGESCGNGLEKIYPTTAVRFGYMRYIGEFTHPPAMKFTCGSRVVVQTRRGIEIGEQVSLTCSGCSKSVTRDQIKSWVQACGRDSFIFDGGRILREATAADLAEYARIQAQSKEKRGFCQTVADRLKLQLRIVECECPFGGERIIFYFTAGERVDFRVLVKELATEYRTRIEMRQVGARDEARLLADYETCGREVCCKAFLKTLKPVSMRMAKLQKATLDPSQVSGRCGRLKCCLRYEHVGYEELDKRLPRNGQRLVTPHGEGVVVARQILTQLVQIRTDADQLISVPLEEIGVPPKPTPPPVIARAEDRPRTENSGAQRGRRNRGGRRPNRGSPGSGTREGADSGNADRGGRDTAKPEPKESTPESGDSDRVSPRKRRRRRSGQRRRPRRDAGSGPDQRPPANP